MRRKCLLSLWEPWEHLPGERCRLLRTFPPVKSPITRFGDFIIVGKAPGRVGAQIIARDTGHWSHQRSLRLVGVGGQGGSAELALCGERGPRARARGGEQGQGHTAEAQRGARYSPAASKGKPESGPFLLPTALKASHLPGVEAQVLPMVPRTLSCPAQSPLCPTPTGSLHPRPWHLTSTQKKRNGLNAE